MNITVRWKNGNITKLQRGGLVDKNTGGQSPVLDAHVTAYIYTPWHTISSIITPNGYETHYGYDDFGRLESPGQVIDSKEVGLGLVL